MNKPSDEFRARFAQEDYPRAFAARYEVIERLSRAESGETLLVLARGGSEYFVAKVFTGADDGAGEVLDIPPHPGLPRMVERIVEGDTRVLVRPFVEGQPLDEALAARPFATEEIVSVAVQLCEALGHLHAQNPPIIHRDVKPQNVILGPDGRVTLIDFGIARTYKPEARRDTVRSGTDDFAPPEQYGFGQTDARADIYSLGMLIKYLATRGELEGELADRRLDRVVRRCTAFAPRQRYRDAEAVKRALLRLEGRAARRASALALAAASLLIGLLIGRYALPYAPTARAVAFVEPAIEQAARLALEKPEGELTAADLARVAELYVVCDGAQANANDFFAAYAAWEAAGRSEAGCLREIGDLAKFPNLDKLYLAAWACEDISPLKNCPNLSHFEVYDNPHLTDISTLSSLAQLRYVGLIKCNNIADIAPLAACPLLTDVDLTGMRTVFDPRALLEMGDFYTLALGGNDEAYRYLNGKSVGWLRLSYTALESAASLATVRNLWRLDLDHTALTSLAGIEAHAGLQYLDISYTAVRDLTPLSALKGLTELVLSEDMRDLAALAPLENLTIRYV